jgi:RNA polymerase sigma-70 factor (ECF subfamily)
VEPQNSKELKILVKESQEGSQTAFQEIFEKLNNRLFAYVLSHTSNREESLDIVQDVFIELWKSLKNFQYRSDEAFYGFVFIIAKRKLYRHHKSKRTNIPLSENEIDESYEIKVENYQYLLKSINMLALKYQDILKLRYWSQMTFREISSVLNIKETTAKVWHHRAIKKLEVLLEKYDTV